MVQIEPGPTPTLTASAPASISASVAAAGGDVAGHDLDAMRALDALAPSRSTAAEWPWAVSTTSRSTPAVDQRRRPLLGVGADADRGADPQPALGVLGRVRELDLLLDVLDRDQAGQVAALVDDRQLLDPVPVQDRAAPRRASCRPAR